MKVTIEGSRTEFEELVELIASGLEYRHRLNVKVQPANDVPNRDREEGVQ